MSLGRGLAWSSRLVVRGGLIGLAGFGLGVLTDSRAAFHRFALLPGLRFVDPEDAHRLAIQFLSFPIPIIRDRVKDDQRLKTKAFGLDFDNPVGVAAGLDKDGEAIDGLYALGFAYVEVGTVTPLPQPGNPRPRYFRLELDRASINRYGFNSAGALAVASRMRRRIASLSQPPVHYDVFTPMPGMPRSMRRGRVLGVNLGRNKSSTDEQDYMSGIRTLGPYADVVVINVSSPNTPGLRRLQEKSALQSLLGAVVNERNKLAHHPAVCVKIAPDLSDHELIEVAEAVKSSKVDGIVISNTTTSRSLHLKSIASYESGGLSGAPLKPISMHALKTIAPRLPTEITIIACGGIRSGKDALEYAAAGAHLVQLYTEFVYDGPGCARRIKDEILEELGDSTWQESIGTKINYAVQ